MDLVAACLSGARQCTLWTLRIVSFGFACEKPQKHAVFCNLCCFLLARWRRMLLTGAN